jgi:vacuolar protein sorting-associated protein 13A/C
LEYRDESLILKDPQNNELNLRIQYSDSNSKSTGRIVSVFCPYIILNKTGQDLYLSAKSLMTGNRITAGQGNQVHNVEKLQPILFSFSTFEPLRSRAHIKVKDSDWSRAISFEAVGSSYMTRLPSAAGIDTLLGIDIQEGLGKYYLSKVVTISPRFVLQNRMREDMVFGQSGNSTPVLLKKGEILPLLKLHTDPDHDDYQMSIKLSHMLGSWYFCFYLGRILLV